MSALPRFVQYPRSDRHHLGKIKVGTLLPFYSVYRNGNAVSEGCQHATLERAGRVAIQQAFSHPGTTYEVWEVTPSRTEEGSVKRLVNTYNTDTLGSNNDHK